MSKAATRTENTRDLNAALAELSAAASVEVFHRLHEMALTCEDPDVVRKIWEGFVRKAEQAEPKTPQITMAPMVLTLNLGDDAVQEPPPKRAQIPVQDVEDAVFQLSEKLELLPKPEPVPQSADTPTPPPPDLSEVPDE